MSKSAKSKNTTLKKVKKLERQGKYQKALKLCDEYLDSTVAEENLILLKIDLLVEYYNNDYFIGLINEYKIKLTNFLEEGQEIELLKIYNTLDNYLELKTQNLANDGIVRSYLAGGLLIDNLETILVLNEMVKDNYESIKNDDEFIENKVPQELKNFVENVSKTTYQYLELILENPKEQIASSNFNLDAIRDKLRKFLEPKKEDSKPIESTEENLDELKDKFSSDIKLIRTSTKENIGLDEFEEVVKNMFFHGELSFNDEVYITNMRHKAAIQDAYNSLQKVIVSIDNDMPEDFYSIDLLDAYESLGSITGETIGEDLVNEIFSKFCMGK